MGNKSNLKTWLVMTVFLLGMFCTTAVISAGDVSWILGESSPVDWNIGPETPTTSDVINFSGPTAIFPNGCVAEIFTDGAPTFFIDAVDKTIELWFQPPPPEYCPFWWNPVCGLEGSFGPLEAGQWVFIGTIPWPDMEWDTFWIPFEVVSESVVYYVDANGSADFETIQEAINGSNAGDEIIVAEGTYIENINFNGKNIILRSTDPNNPAAVGATIIDGNDVNSVVTFSGTESSDCVLTGFTITDGNAPEGGGIYGNGTIATIQNNIIRDNKAERIGPPGAHGDGGGLYDCDGLIQNNIITGNDAGLGGGGGLHSCDGTITNNIISQNGSLWGGGLYSCNGTIRNNLLVGNMAVYGGGVADCDGSISNCTVVGNYGANGHALYECTGIIANCVIWQNGAGAIEQIKSCSTPIYSCIEDWGGGGIGNISADPCFVRMGYWQDMGTYWEWVDNAGDYHLQSQAGRWDPNTDDWVTDANTSPCIDAGNPGCPLGDEPNDANNVRINMGAYGGAAEASKTPANWGILADLTNDRIVNFNDLAAFVDYWLDSGECIPSDLNRSESVDFVDFAVFTQQPSNTPVAEPSIVYEITPCDLELLAAEQSGQTRFTVTVEGSYIHFEDMMVANCCPDELELEMIVEDNLITIYEVEHTTMPCRCICDYPVMATLGPFEPGTYTLEVYEDWGGFIGSTIVIID